MSKQVKKWFYVIGIVSLIVCTSVFMVLESGHFFSQFYPVGSLRGYWAATICEIFLVVFAAISFRRKKKLNFVLKVISGFLFVSVIVGSSFNLVQPLWQEYSSNSNHEKLINFLEQEQYQNKNALYLVQGQKVNTILTLKQQRATNIEYKNALKTETRNSKMIISAILTILIIRITMQSANFALSYCLGIVYRKR